MNRALRLGSTAQTDREARFQALYTIHAPTVRRILYRMCEANELDDLVQITFLKIYEHLESVRDPGSERAWICQVALNAARDSLRRKKRMAWLRYVVPAEIPQPESPEPMASERLASEELLRNAIQSLPPKLQDTVILFSIEELEITEVASALGVPEGTVKSRISQAREKLRQFFREEDHE